MLNSRNEGLENLSHEKRKCPVNPKRWRAAKRGSVKKRGGRVGGASVGRTVGGGEEEEEEDSPDEVRRWEVENKR